MLQFGSFETRDEAEKRLGDVKSKHASTLGGLPVSVREVKLPPDNLTVYRTQAGPVESRSAAQSVCAKFASAGDECYIVQTAMMGGAAPAVVADAKPAANSVLPQPQLAAPVSAKPADVTSNLSMLQDVPARDAGVRERIASVNSSMSAVDATPADAPIAVSPQMQDALDKAAANQDAAAASVTQATNKASESAKSTHGFWSRLNPFSDEEDAPSAPAAATETAKVIVPESAPVEPVVVEASLAPAAAAPAPIEPLPPQVLPEPAQQPKIMVTRAAPEPVVMQSAPVITEPQPMLLPPPPAPLKAQAPMPVSTGAMPPLPAPQPVMGNGSVNVEEAKRVPVTETAQAPMPVAAPPVILQKPLPPVQPPVSLSPSATDGVKTMWAQIGPFADNQAALNFWNHYRQTHPDFPVVRVRVTTPYQQNANQAWLRVGPVTRAGFIKNLCGSLPIETTLRCGHVVDMGAAGAAKGTGKLSPSRYQR